MRTLLLILALATAHLRASEDAHTSGCEQDVGGYANLTVNALVGSTTTAIDLAVIPVIYVKSAATNTSFSQLFYWFTSDGGTLVGNSVSLAHGSYCIKKKGRFISFGISGNTGARATISAATGSEPAFTLPTGAATESGQTAVFNSISSAARATWHYVTTVAFTSLTSGVTSNNLSATAGVNASLGLYIRAHGGGAAIAWEVTNSITPPGGMAVNAGNYLGTGTTTQIVGPFPAGHAFHHVVSGTASVTGSAAYYTWF